MESHLPNAARDISEMLHHDLPTSVHLVGHVEFGWNQGVQLIPKLCEEEQCKSEQKQDSNSKVEIIIVNADQGTKCRVQA